MKHLKTFNENTNPTQTNRWKYEIDIKKHLNDDHSPEMISKLCKIIMNALTRIKIRIPKSNLVEDEIFDTEEELERIIDNFDFLDKLCAGDIKEEEWEDYSFNGNYVELLDDYLTELYDLGDKRVLNKRNEIEKFMFIK